LARAPNEKVSKAKSLYLNDGRQLVEIADILGVAPGTVRSWKNRYKWDDATQRDKRNVAEEKKQKKDRIPPAVKSVMENDDLTDQQKEFCLLFSRSFNATQSYLKAFGSTYNTARTEGSRLLAKPSIKTEITRLKEERYTRAYLSEEDIFQRYMDIAFSDIGDYVWFGREMVPVMGPFGPLMEKLPDGTEQPLMKEINSVRFREASEVDTSLLAEVKQGKDGSSIKLMDRMKALEWLADHMDIATEKQKLELQLIKTQIEAKAGNEEELSKLDLMLQNMDEAAKK
jgi:phage terminase small subunit